jgi:predicted lipoprotein with Yx(FWY)xxD motif
MRTRFVSALGLTIMLGLAACGGSNGNGNGNGDQAAAGDAAATTAPAAPAAGDTVSVKSADSPLGDILVGPEGQTLYGFTNDVDGQSSCSGTCAEAWPPLTVGADWTVGPGLDSAVFNTVAREDGTQQLVAGRWPLYYFSGDTAPGDVNGQGSGGVWFAVRPDATLVDGPAPSGGADDAAGEEQPGYGSDQPGQGEESEQSAQAVQVAETSLGDVLVDGEGMTLYGFTDDADGTPTCTGDCAATWPALLVEGEPAIGDALDPAVFSTVDGAEGGTQLKAGEWPLYRFSGDSAPGDVNGQGSGGVWFAVAPDGTLVDAG